MKITKHKEQKATKGSTEYFTGNVTIDSPFANDRQNSYSGAVVSFSAGARTAWHTHPMGQTLIILSGKGFAQVKGGIVQELEVGDVVWFAPEECHWHGARSDSPMVHVAIAEAKDSSVVTWLEKVTDKEYLSK